VGDAGELLSILLGNLALIGARFISLSSRAFSDTDRLRPPPDKLRLVLQLLVDRCSPFRMVLSLDVVEHFTLRALGVPR